ncbi:MAG: ArnT family glycosyltransferase [Elusimicrobiota bacterium]
MVFLLWVAVVFLFYFSIQDWPFGHILKSTAGWFVILLISLGIGIRIISAFRIKTSTFLENLCLCLGMGLGTIQIVMMLFGFLGLYSKLYIYLFIGITIVFLYKDILLWLKTAYEKWKKYSGNRFSIIGACILIILVLGLILSFINSLSLPINDYTLSGQMALAKEYILSGKIANMRYQYSANMPSGMSMLFVLGIIVYGVSVARLITFTFFLLLTVGIYSMGRRFFHRRIALFASAITVSTPVIMKFNLLDHYYIPCTFFAFMALYTYICWAGHSSIDNKSQGWIFVSGIFTSFSLFFGLFSMFFPLVLLIMIFYYEYKISNQRDISKIVRKMSCYLIPFVGVLLILFLKNYLIATNPFFPFFLNSTDKNMQIIFKGTKSLWGYLLPLWYIPFSRGLSVYNFYYTGLSCIVFLPGIFLVKEIGKTMRVLLFFIGIYFLIFIIAGRRIGFFYPLIPIFSMVVSYLIVSVYRRKKYYFQIITAVFFLTLGVNLYTVIPWLKISENINFVFDYKTEKEYLYKNIEGYGSMDYINKNTPVNSKILCLGEKRTFYIKRKTIKSDFWNIEPMVEIINKVNNSKELNMNLSKLGITHLFINQENILNLKKYHSYYWNSKVERIFKRLINKHAELKYSEGEFKIYEL